MTCYHPIPFHDGNLLPSNFTVCFGKENRTTHVSATSTVQPSFQKPLQLIIRAELKSELIPLQMQLSEEIMQLVSAKGRWGQATQQIQRHKCSGVCLETVWKDTEKQEYICKSAWTVRCYFCYKCYCSQPEPWEKKKKKKEEGRAASFWSEKKKICWIVEGTSRTVGNFSFSAVWWLQMFVSPWLALQEKHQCACVEMTTLYSLHTHTHAHTHIHTQNGFWTDVISVKAIIQVLM